MYTRHLIISAFLILFSTPVFAASYYIVQNTTTKVCSVTTQPPDGSSHVQITYSTFSTRQTATVAMNVTPECSAKSEKVDTKKK